MRIGIDIGGTFTDIVVQDAQGDRKSWKTLSTPPEFEKGLLAGVSLAAESLGLQVPDLLDQTEHFVHGTTVTTNVVLTRTGERVALITTRGHKDFYPLARQYRGQEQDPSKILHPRPLVEPSDIIEVTERVDFAGDVVAPLNEVEVREAVERLVAEGVRAFAICFLWSFVNPAHEERTKEIILEILPDAYVAASFETAPILGEYERTSTSVINAYAGPSLYRYARGLGSELREKGLPGPMLLMKSDGGPARIDTVVSAAAQTVYSGPAAGVVAAKSLGERLNQNNLITFDMGGTSTDVALVVDGEIQMTSNQRVEDQPLAIPMIDVTSVGAGGGSLGSQAIDGSLKVGPESAGSTPGPACYGRGGRQPTVTDANVVLGLLDPKHFLGGTMILHEDRAEAAVGNLAGQLGLTAEETALGIFRVANAIMADAIRLRTVFKGLDPRIFTLVSFGGAGGLHCAAVAAELGVNRVIVPHHASTYSAVGLVNCDLVFSAERSANVEVLPGAVVDEASLKVVNGVFAELDEKIIADLEKHEVDVKDRTILHSVEVSYAGQILDFPIEVPASELVSSDIRTLVEVFDERYARAYGPGAAAPEYGYLIKSFKAVGVGRIQDPTDDGLMAADAAISVRKTALPKGTRRAIVDLTSGAFGDIDVYDGAALEPGSIVPGPAMLEYSDTTVLVPESFEARIDKWLNAVLEKTAIASGKMN